MPPYSNEIFERAQELVDRRRLVIGLCAAVAVALIAAIPGVLMSADDGRNVRTGAFAGAPPTTGVATVIPVPGAPAAPAPPLPSPSTTSPALVLGSTFVRPTTTVPSASAPKPTPKPAAAPTTTTTSKPTPGSAAPFCRNSYNPSCGPFRWDPAPAQNQPRQVSLSGPATVRVGDQVTVHAVVTDPDDSQAFKCPTTTYDFKDGPSVSNHCDPPPGPDPCPKRYGPWTPPTAAAGGGEEDVAHTFSTPGTYMVQFTYDLGYEDACYNPYADGASGTLTITVTP